MLVLALSLAISLPAFAAKKDTIQKDDILTVNSYIEWLESQVSKTNIESNSLSSKKVEAASDVIKKFKALTKEKQELFVSYLSDTTIINKMFNAKNIGKTVLENGDIVVTGTVSTESDKTAQTSAAVKGLSSSRYTRTATYKWTQSILGIEIFQITNWVKYTDDGDAVIYEILGGNGAVTKAWDPFIQGSWSGQNTYIERDPLNDKASFEADFTYSVGPIKGLSLQMYTANTGASGWAGGGAEGWFDIY